MANAFIIDSGGIGRATADPWIIDPSASRRIKKWWIIDSGGVARLVLPKRADITIGSTVSLGTLWTGYYPAIPVGSLNYEAVVNVLSAYDFVGSSSGIVLQLGGFGANPGQSYFTNIVAPFGSLSSASAILYGYSSGTASWQWNYGSSGFWSLGSTGVPYLVYFR